MIDCFPGLTLHDRLLSRCTIPPLFLAFVFGLRLTFCLHEIMTYSGIKLYVALQRYRQVFTGRVPGRAQLPFGFTCAKLSLVALPRPACRIAPGRSPTIPRLDARDQCCAASADDNEMSTLRGCKSPKTPRAFVECRPCWNRGCKKQCEPIGSLIGSHYCGIIYEASRPRVCSAEYHISRPNVELTHLSHLLD